MPDKLFNFYSTLMGGPLIWALKHLEEKDNGEGSLQEQLDNLPKGESKVDLSTGRGDLYNVTVDPNTLRSNIESTTRALDIPVRNTDELGYKLFAALPFTKMTIPRTKENRERGITFDRNMVIPGYGMYANDTYGYSAEIPHYSLYMYDLHRNGYDENAGNTFSNRWAHLKGTLSLYSRVLHGMAAEGFDLDATYNSKYKSSETSHNSVGMMWMKYLKGDYKNKNVYDILKLAEDVFDKERQEQDLFFHPSDLWYGSAKALGNAFGNLNLIDYADRGFDRTTLPNQDDSNGIIDKAITDTLGAVDKVASMTEHGRTDNINEERTPIKVSKSVKTISKPALVRLVSNSDATRTSRPVTTSDLRVSSTPRVKLSSAWNKYLK